MAEVYPSDNELLNIQYDSETGIEYIPTGQAPYYLQFRKMLYRMILAAKRANELRVYDEGGLDVGVKDGKFFNGTELVTVSATSANTLADDKASIYIYLDAAGNLVTDEYSSFPDMATTPHIRLAIVATSNGNIDLLTDCRSGHNFVIPFSAGGIKKTIEAHTADDTLTQSESGSVHTNLAATAVVTIMLPAAASAGTTFTFAVQSAYELRIDPGAAAIRDDSGQTADKYKYAGAIGACLGVVADENGDWAVVVKNGTWTEEA